MVTPCEAEAGRRILGVVGRVGAGRDTPGGAVCLPTWLLLGERSAGIVPRGMQLTEGAGFKRALRPPGLSAKGVPGANSLKNSLQTHSSLPICPVGSGTLLFYPRLGVTASSVQFQALWRVPCAVLKPEPSSHH